MNGWPGTRALFQTTGSLACSHKSLQLTNEQRCPSVPQPLCWLPREAGASPKRYRGLLPSGTHEGALRKNYFFSLSHRNCLCWGPLAFWKPDLLCINPTITAPHCPYFIDSLPPPSSEFLSIIHSLKIHLTINSTRRKNATRPRLLADALGVLRGKRRFEARIPFSAF